jgi:rubrerythrin
MFDQITATYGRPTPAVLLHNDTLFRSVYSPQDAPEVLFRRIEDCQEVQILGEDPYTVQQLLNNAVCLLLQTGLCIRDFEDWDRKIAADKIWTNLKTFIQEAYTHCLNATSITTGAQGYVQNAYTALAEESEEDKDDVHTVITQMAALTTQSQLSASMAAETANQQAMQQQFAAFTATHNTMYQPAQAPPLMQQLTIPSFGTFQPAGLGFGGRRGGRGCGERANTGRHGCTPFANFVSRGNQGGLPPIGGGGRGGGIAPFAQQNASRNATPMYSNIIKRYANWNVCFSCGFDVENGHTSKTCPAPWRRANHQEGYMRKNSGQYILAGYDACTKAMHKSQLPTM